MRLQRKFVIGMTLFLFAGVASVRLAMEEGEKLTQTIPVPEDFTSLGLMCDSDRLFVFGYRRALTELSTDVAILRWEPPQPTWDVSYSSTNSHLVTWNRASDGTLHALVSLGAGRSILLRSSDDGRSWSTKERVPDRAIGTAFLDVRTAFAWDERFAYRTHDGGITWRSREALGVTQAGPPWPVLVDGQLWIARTASPDGYMDSLVAIDESLATTATVVPPDPISHMVARGPDLWLLGRQGRFGRARISKLETQHGNRALPVYELNDDLPLEIAVREPRLAVLLAEVTPRQSERYVLFKADEQDAKWTKFSVGSSDSVQTICLDGNGVLWAIGRKWLWRTPLDRQ